jgi:hypothetical protein
MTAGSQGHAGSQEHDAGSQGHGAGLRIGVVLEAFLDWPLERVLAWLPEAAPEHLRTGDDLHPLALRGAGDCR